ncbi:hypothetical protein WFZ85_02995 [Flavobacterium sp. j3]|jgi:hypothetical protein|uniref:Uncharacterized protein n=1 Tax=Flavobacterium aureirubrum TaxID=3133147 RepID=A0ABU9N226_9FLAO
MTKNTDFLWLGQTFAALFSPDYPEASGGMHCAEKIYFLLS